MPSATLARAKRQNKQLPSPPATAKTIEGVSIRPLRRIPDERGTIMHMMRRDDPWHTRFGEIYFSTVYPGAIKAWHLHTRMTLNYAVLRGMIKLVLYDDREGSPSRGVIQELFTGETSYALVTVPPLVWNGFKGIGVEEAIVANCPDEPHDPGEIQRLDPMSGRIPYDWSLRHG